MKTGTKVLIVIGAIVLLLVLIIGGTYNGLVNRREEVNGARSEIDNQLKRRSELIPNLVSTVKAYAKHEEEVFANVTEARTKLMNAGSTEAKLEANEEMSAAITRILAIAEAYPELKANENFLNLQHELAGTANRISTAVRDYNKSAQNYNASIKRFPTVIFANMFGFDEVNYYEVPEEQKENPNVGDLFD